MEAAASDPTARFERLYEAHLAQVLAYALRRTDSAAAQDIAAETFLVAWRRIADVPEDALPWLYAVARRRLANRTRTSARQAALVERLAAEPPPLAAAVSPEELDRGLTGALAMLSEDDRELIRLLAWEGLERHEAAVALGVGRAVLRLRLHRARRRLAAALAAQAGAEGADPSSPSLLDARGTR